MTDMLKPILAVFVLVMGSMVGLTIADDVVNATSGTADGAQTEDAQRLQGTSFVRVNSFGSGNNETVRNSRGKALHFDGTQSAYLTADTGVDIHTSDNWTVKQTVWINASATGENMTVVTEGDPNIIVRYAGNQAQAEWQVIYYPDLAKSYISTVDATDPTNETHLYAQRNASSMVIYRNTTAGSSTAIDDTSDTVPNMTADGNLHGDLDETRMFATELSAAQRTQLRDSPNDGITGVTHAARITFDEYLENPSQVRVWWTGQYATLGSGTSFVDGHPGEVLEEKTLANDIAGTSDYAWQNDGPRIRAVSGGQLDGSPVAYITYDFLATSVSVVRSFGDMVSLAAFVGLIIVAGLIIGKIRSV